MVLDRRDVLAPVCLLSLALAACGSDGGAQARGSGSGGASAGSSASGGDVQAGRAGAGEGGASGGSSGAVGDCSRPAVLGDGALERAFTLQGALSLFDVKTACDGSFVVSGYATNSLELEGQSGPITLSSDDYALRFVARFDAEGNALWARALKCGPAESLGPYVELDAGGDVILGGSCSEIAIFAEGESGETRFEHPNSRSIPYVARYDEHGNFLWARDFAQDVIYLRHFSPGPDGTTYVLVSSDTASTIGKGEIDFTFAPDEHALIKVGGAGELLRAVRFSTEVSASDLGLKVQTSRDVAIGSTFEAGAVLGGGTADESALDSTQGNAFFATFTPELELETLKVFDAGRIVPLADGGFLTQGRIVDAVSLGGDQPSAVTLVNTSGPQDEYVARYDQQAALVWATQLDAVHSFHTLYFGGGHDGSAWVSLSSTSVEPSELIIAPGGDEGLAVPAEGEQAFLIRLGAEGQPAWGQSLASDGFVLVHGFDVSPHGGVLFGDVSGTLTFSSSSTTLYGEEGINADTPFVALYGP